MEAKNTHEFKNINANSIERKHKNQIIFFENIHLAEPEDGAKRVERIYKEMR